jgi:hypothetical protein
LRFRPLYGPPPMKRVARVRRDYFNGSFTTTFTPLIVPVTTPRTSFTAVVLISPAPLSAPVAAAVAPPRR